MSRAVRAAEEFTPAFDAVTDDAAATVLADGSKFVNCALEAVKDVTLPSRDDFETQSIIVVADFALSHVCETDRRLLEARITVSQGRASTPVSRVRERSATI
jgi:hypothetical protein